MKRAFYLCMIIMSGLFLNSCLSRFVITADSEISNWVENIETLDLTQVYPSEQKPENIILLIGDGMGVGHVQLASLAANGDENQLYMEQMPHFALMQTWSLGGQSEYTSGGNTTDSAAAGTAMTTGVKTFNGRLCIDRNGESLETIAEKAEAKGYQTGVIATKSITDATPAAFYSHQQSRNSHSQIAVQLVNSGIDLALGGGMKYFSSLKDEISKRSISLVEDEVSLMAADTLPLFGLFASDKLVETDSEPLLDEMTKKAIELFEAEGKPFFLMSEGSQIDSYSHSNNQSEVIRRTLNFDLAVKEALKYASTNQDTLVVVLADHETGGLIVHDYKADQSIEIEWNSGGHTTQRVGVYSYGPGAQYFNGIIDNTDVSKILSSLLN